MLSLPSPRFTALYTYTECVNGMRSGPQKTHYADDAPCVAEADKRYARAGAAGAAHALRAADFGMTTVTAAEMTWLYENRLVGRKSSARDIYDKLKQMAPFGRCALCGVRDATTLDHYLPKSTYPSLAVNPLNLMPCCGRCNQLKSSRVGATVHAYFDKLSDDVWLSAYLDESKPCVVRFQIDPPSSWPGTLVARAREQFTMLRLGELYTAQASRALRGDALSFRRAFASDGPRGVRVYVGERAASWAHHDRNCWEAAMYTAMARSSWFCDGGFEIG